MTLIHYSSTPDDVPSSKSENGISQIDLDFYPNGINKKCNLSVNWGWDLFNQSSLNGYNVDLAKVGLILSAAAENSQFVTEELMKKLGYVFISSTNYRNRSAIFQPAATFGYKSTINSNGEIQHNFAIVVRGTTSFDDIITDIMSVFDTFHTAGITITAQFRNFLNFYNLDLSKIKNNSKFFITGHSLGGATANVIAHDLNNDITGYKKENIFAYTFASPRTSRNPLALISDRNIYNLINTQEADPVPLLPPIALNGFPTFRYGRDVLFQTPTSSDEYRSAFKFLTDTEYNYDLTEPIKPHFVQSYMAELINRKGSVIESLMGMLVKVACPVDIDIYDSNNQLIGSVKNNVIADAKSDKIGFYVDNDVKYIYFADDDTYTLRMTGTDSGTMEYTSQAIDLGGCEVTKEKSFKNVSLTKGKQMVSYINVENETDLGTDVSKIPLYVLDNDGNLDKEILPDSKGTEVQVVHTITLDANGGTVSPSAIKTGDGRKLSNLPIPVRNGYQFKGWYTSANSGTKITTDTVFNNDMTIYAQWTATNNNSSGSSAGGGSYGGGSYGSGGYYGGSNYIMNYTITFNVNGGVLDNATAKTGTNGKLSSLPTPVRSGYKFDGWYTELSGGTQITTDTIFNKNTMVYAHWIELEPEQPSKPDEDTQPVMPDVIPEQPSVSTYKKGDKVTDISSKAVYKITKIADSDGAGGTVAYVSSTNKQPVNVIIPDVIKLDGTSYKVTKVLSNAVKNKTSLKTVKLGKNVVTIGNGAFYGCKNLKTVTIGNGVKTIWPKAFYKCKSLTKIVIPTKVTQIGKQAFYGCKKLKTIQIKTAKLTTKTIGSKAFAGIVSKATIIVPAKSLKTYRKLLVAKGVSQNAKIKK